MRPPFARLIEWMRAHLDDPLDVPALRGPRRRPLRTQLLSQVRRGHRRDTGALRRGAAQLDAARALLAKGLSLKSIAGQVGLQLLGAARARRSSAVSAWRRRYSARCTRATP